MDLLDNYLSFKTLQSFPVFDADENGRQISVFCCKDVVVVGANLQYPNIVLFSHETQQYIIPYLEQTMSLKDSPVRATSTFDYKIIDENYYFFFVYNTDNYYHFIYDAMPYLISYFHMKRMFPKLKLLLGKPLHGNQHYKFVLEFLNIAGVEDSDLCCLQSGCLYKNLLVSNSFTHDGKSNQPPRSEVYSFLQSLAKKIGVQQTDYPSKVYVSRRSWIHKDTSNIGTNYTTRRKFINEDELVRRLQKLSYREVFAEQLSTKNKLALFQGSSRVVGAIGGGMSNALFCKPETKLLVLVSPTFLDVNERFKFCFSNTNTSYFNKTFHTETTEWKRFMRVFHPKTKITGEILQVEDKELVVQYCNSVVTGWNNSTELKTQRLPKSECEALDRGLNSSWTLNIEEVLSLL